MTESVIKTFLLYRSDLRMNLRNGTANAMEVHLAIEASRCQHFLKAEPLWAVVKVVLKHMDILMEGPHPHYKTVQRRLKQISGITLDVLFWDRRNDRTKRLKGIDAIRRKKYPGPKWQLVYVVSHVNVKRMLQFHRSRHTDPSPESFSVADLSFDGVKLTNSCGRSFEAVSCQFEGCRQVYPLSIGIAEKGFSELLTAKHVMSQPIRNLTANGVRIRNIIPDHPKRSGE